MSMNAKLEAKLKELPKEPGVYFHRDAKGKIIYIGKAANLKNRVSSYFASSTKHSPKNVLLVQDIAMTDWITVDSEVEALFMESELIKRYMPKYNVDLRDDKHWLYIRIPMQDVYPAVSYVRRPLDDGADYFGPFTSGDAVRKAMKQLRRIFPYVTHATLPARGCLQYHLGLCPGPEEGAISSTAYKKSLRQLMMYLRGHKTKLFDRLEREMKAAAKQKDYELAATRRDQLNNLRALGLQMIFGDRETFDLARDQALAGLSDRLGLKGAPRRIECYDISHFQGSDTVASMVVFTDGVANKDEYRRFNMRVPGNDDFAHMREVLSRRFDHWEDWPKPDLLVIDGGKGQLSAALEILDKRGLAIPAIGLAKREEEIIVRKVDFPDADLDTIITTKSSPYGVVLLPKTSAVLQLLQRLRDEAHRFAVTYHGLLRGKRQTSSELDSIPGIGVATRKKLLQVFGSVRGVKAADATQLVAAVGQAKADAIELYLRGRTP